MNIGSMVSNISTQGLMRIAPKVERLAGRDLPADIHAGPVSSDVQDWREIMTEVNRYQPPVSGQLTARAMLAHQDARRQSLESGNWLIPGAGLAARPGEFIGGNIAGLNDDGTHTVFTSMAEAEEHARNFQQNMLEQLMAAINAARATDPQQINDNNSGFNITV